MFRAMTLLSFAFFGMTAQAEEAVLKAEIDRTVIELDESVTVTLKLEATDQVKPSLSPKMDAPDFEMINSFRSSSVSATYVNGSFGVKNSSRYSYVLRPKKAGQFEIRNIRIDLGGKVLRAPNLKIKVVKSSGLQNRQQAPSFRNRGRGLNPSPSRSARGRPISELIFLEAEVSRKKVYKGEQVLVDYYLYSQPRTITLNSNKFPVLKGFLREELEMPIVRRGRRDMGADRVVRNGLVYTKRKLVSYAAYPLKTGRLEVDPLEVKLTYYDPSAPSDSMNDPFTQFFRQMSPRVGTFRSKVKRVDVIDLPPGKPSDFSGGVGVFSVSGAVNRYEVQANEPVTLKVIVQGRGNADAIREPDVPWPEEFDLFETKGTAKTNRAGISEKVFEFLLIPRVPGEYKIPPVRFSFFDPKGKRYMSRETQAVQIKVTPSADGKIVTPQSRRQSRQVQPNPDKSSTAVDDLRYLKRFENSHFEILGQPWWRLLYWFSLIGFALLGGFVLIDKLRSNRTRGVEKKRKRSKVERSSDWDRLRRIEKDSTQKMSHGELLEYYNLLEDLIFDLIQREYNVNGRGISRTRLAELLVESQKVDAATWTRLDNLLGFTEYVRFSGTGHPSAEAEARQKLLDWAQEAIALVEEIRTNSKVTKNHFHPSTKS